LQVLQENKDWDPAPFQWATVGYSGAINSGKTICGTLFGSAVFLGHLYGKAGKSLPGVNDDKRTKAIESTNKLFNGFIERFGHTDCRELTNCDFSKKEEVEKYRANEVYKDTCFHQLDYVLTHCLAQK
jgi:hypothetical protein